MKAVKGTPLRGVTSAKTAPHVGSMTNAEAAVEVAAHGHANDELPDVKSASGVTSGSCISPCTSGVFNSAQQPVEDEVASVSKHGHLKSTGKKSRRRHHRKNQIDDDDAQFSLPPVDGQSKAKTGHHSSQDGLATHKSHDDVQHRRRNSGSEDVKPEDTVNVASGASLNQTGSKELSPDHATTGAVAAFSPAEKKSQKKRKKHHKAGGSEHLSDMFNHADSKNGPNVIRKPVSDVSSPEDAVAQLKPNDAAAISEKQVDITLQTDKAHQAVPAEAASKEPHIPQADKLEASDYRQQQLEVSKTSKKSKLKRPLPTMGGPFGGLSSTRCSSLDRSVEHRASDARSIGVEKETQLDATLETDEAHQAVSKEAAPKQPEVPQAHNVYASNDRQQQLDDLKKAAAAKSKLKRPLPTKGGPFGGLSSTRSSSIDRSVEHQASDTRSIGVEKGTQLDAALETNKSHQAVSKEAAPKEPEVLQAHTVDASDNRQKQLEDLKKAAATKSKLKRPLPTTGGPFGGLSSTRTSSLDRSVEHQASDARSIGVEKETLSLSPKQTFWTNAHEAEAHAEQPGQRATFSLNAQESEVKLSMPDHAGGSFTAISQTEKEHSETNGSHLSSGVSAGNEDSPAAQKQPSPIMHHGPGTGRRVSITLPKWGGPFGGPFSSVDQASESLHDKVAAQTAEAKPVPPQESPLDVTPSAPDAVKKEEETLPPDRGALPPPTVQKKIARHVLEETAFTVLSTDSEEGLDAQQSKATQSTVSSVESSAFRSSQGSFVPSPHPQFNNDVKAPCKMRSMSLVLLEDAPFLLSKPTATASPPAPSPTDVVPSLPKLESVDFSQQAPFPSTTGTETEKRDKEAKNEMKKNLKKAATKEVTSSLRPLSKDGHDQEKPAPTTFESQCRAHSVDEINKRIEVLQCQPFDLGEPSNGSHTPLRPVNFKQDHAVLTDKGEVKLCLDLSTRKEVEMLWPFDIEARMAKREDA